jgi:hypothetical protein
MDILQRKTWGTVSLLVHRHQTHQRYQHVITITSNNPTSSKPWRLTGLPHSSFLRIEEPEWSNYMASHMSSCKPKACQSSCAIGQRNKRCLISSGPWPQIGHSLEVPICRLARIHFRGNIPWKACNIKILFERVFRTGLHAEDPGKANWLAEVPNWCSTANDVGIMP